MELIFLTINIIAMLIMAYCFVYTVAVKLNRRGGLWVLIAILLSPLLAWILVKCLGTVNK